MAQEPRYLEPAPAWTAEEKPTLPGSPGQILHPVPKRFLYFFIGLFITLSAGLSNGFITANLPAIQGEYGLTPLEAAWIPAIFVMANVSSNLILFKARQQYGLRFFSEIGLIVFIAVLILHLFVRDFEMALFVRFISGLTAAPLSSLGIYYTMQAFKREDMAKGLYLGLGFQQLGLPLAWIISPALVNVNDWAMLYTFELGLAVCCLAMVVSLKLPRSLRIEVFEKKDFLTFFLLAPGFALLCIVLAQGPILWWFDAPQLAYALIASLVLIIVGLIYEHYRENPLIMTRWLGLTSTLQFIFSALALRFLMSEQSYAAVNFLKAMGMGPDQLVSLYGVIFTGIVIGTIFSAVTFSKETIILHLLFAELLILLACGLDYHLTSDIRPANFFLSQFLIGFTGGMFIGPLLLVGALSALKHGAGHIVTFMVLFSATQTFGGLMGSSFFSTYQQQRTQTYRAELTSQLNPTDPQVAKRLALYQKSTASTINDPVLQKNQEIKSLNQIITREAQVRAYNDVIALNGVFAIFIFIGGAFNIARAKWRNRKENTPT